jgi:TPP-dependent pyruvate/acetoin dehydrogenase alpha subunit
LVEALTMRMMGHAIHDGFEYVPRELLTYWEHRDPVRLYRQKLLDEGVTDAVELEEIEQRCRVEVAAAVDGAEAAPYPAPESLLEGVYAT